MRLIMILPLLLAGCAPTSSVVREGEPFTFQTSKSSAQVEKCLTDGLSKLDDITAVASEGVTTLMFGGRTKPRMLIDIAPPRVAVTTTLAYGTREIIAACV